MNLSDFGIANGLSVVIIGFGMVFLILFIISFVLSIFSFVYKLKEKKKLNPQALNTQTKTEEISDKNNNSDIHKQKDDLELIAVITASIASSINTTSDKIIVHSIRKTSNWNKTAISENHKNFY